VRRVVVQLLVIFCAVGLITLAILAALLLLPTGGR
jgi:hypothetical protein